jgi:hypothetical protein
VLFHLHALTFVSWLTPARWSVSALGGIAGLDAAALQQSSGLYPHSAVGLLWCWLLLVVLLLALVAGTAWSLSRQGRAWQTGSDAPPPLLRSALDALAGSRSASRAPSGPARAGSRRG